jgi:hydroxyacylglutathione hydrolase
MNTPLIKSADGVHSVELIAPNTYRIDEATIANCYLLIGEKKALLIDTGDGVGNLLETVESLTNKPVEVVLTHRHCDHAGGRNWFKDYSFHKNDNHWIYALESSGLATQKLAGMSGKSVTITKKPYHAKKHVFSDTQVFDLGGRIVRIMNVPGHTRGSIVLLDEKEKLMFTGDEVNYWLWLQLPGCTNVVSWLPNAKKILSLMDEYKAYCGHNDGLVTKAMVQELVTRGEELVAGKKGIDIGHGVYSYPDNDWQHHSVIWYKRVK